MALRITDLLSQPLNQSTHHGIILVHLGRDSPLVRQLVETSGYGVYRVTIPPQLSSYVGMGDLIIKDGWTEITVPLVHKQFPHSISVNQYQKIKSFSGGYIWIPVGDDIDFRPLGMIFSVDKPSINTGLLHKNIIIESANKINGIGQMNEYRLIGVEQPLRTIDRLAVVDQQPKDDRTEITETLDQWKPVEGKEVVLRIPAQPWFHDKPEHPPEVINQIKQVNNTDIDIDQIIDSAFSQNKVVDQDLESSSIDYFGIILTISTIIIIIYHLSKYVHQRFISGDNGSS